MYRDEEAIDTSARSARSKSSTDTLPPGEYPERYNRSNTHPPHANDGYSGHHQEEIIQNRRKSNDSSGGGKRKKAPPPPSEFRRASITNSTTTKKMSNNSNQHHHHHRVAVPPRSSDNAKSTEKTPSTEKTSSISSSSTTSLRRRKQEVERQKEHRGAGLGTAQHNHNEDGGSDHVVVVDRITPIMEVGGDNFVQELKVDGGGGTNSQGGTAVTTTAQHKQHSVGSDHSQQQQQQQHPSRGGDHHSRGNDRSTTKNKYNQLDWPSAPPDHFMDDLPPPSRHGTSQHSGGGGGAYYIDDTPVQNAQSPQQQQQQQTTAPQPAAAPPGRRAVLHACDDKGRCLFHPHIILRKKAILGVMGGWKDLLPACPECESEDIMGGAGGIVVQQQQRQVKKFEGAGGGGGGSAIDGSGSSRELSQGVIGPRRKTPSYESHQEEEEEEEETEEGESSSDDSSSDSSSSSSSSSDASSSSSSEDEPSGGGGGGGGRHNAANFGQKSERLPPRPHHKGRGGGGANKAIANKARKMNKLLATGAGNNIKKMRSASKPRKGDGDFISSYISSGVASSRPKKNNKVLSKSLQNTTDQTMPSSLRRPSDPLTKYPQTLSPDNSMDNNNVVDAAQQQGKKMLKGVSKLIRKSKKTISKSVNQAADRISQQHQQRTNSFELCEEDDYDNYNYSSDGDGNDHDMYDGSQERQFFESYDPSRHRQQRQDRKHRHHGEQHLPPVEPTAHSGGEKAHHSRHKHRGHEKRGERPRPRRDPSGAALHFDGLRVHKSSIRSGDGGGDGVSQKKRTATAGGENISRSSKWGSRARRKSSLDSSASSNSHGTAGSASGPTATTTTTPYNSDVAYQWDRVPLPESSLPPADDNSTEESAEGESASEADPHDTRLADVAYQWDRVPLPMVIDPPSPPLVVGVEEDEDEEKSIMTIPSHDTKHRQWEYEKQEYYRQRSQEEEERRKRWDSEGRRRSQPTARDESMSPTSGLTAGNLDSSYTVLDMEEVSNTRQASSTSSGTESKPPGKGAEQMGLLSMQDLLQSIQQDTTMPKLGRNGSSSTARENSSSMPNLDRSGTSSSSRGETSSLYEGDQGNSFDDNYIPTFGLSGDTGTRLKEGKKNLSAPKLSDVDFKSDEGSSDEGSSDGDSEVKEEMSQQDDLNPASALSSLSIQQDSDAPKPQGLSLMGNYGGLKIDLSALQASKPTKKPDTKDGDTTSGDIKIDSSVLQASKPMKKEEEEKPAQGDDQPGRHDLLHPTEEAPMVDESVPTFETSNLPFTGQFGESGMYTGLVNGQYEPHGKGTMVYDNGEILKGYWNAGDLVRESELYSDSEDDDEDEDDEEEEDLSSSMVNVSSKVKGGKYSGSRGEDRSRSRSRSTSRGRQEAPAPPPPKPPSPSPSPPPPEYKVGDPGKHRDMILDKEEASAIVEQLKFGDGAFIRRSDGKWSYAVVKSLEESEEGKSAIRFTVNDRNSSKSYAKKYWGTHVRPLKGTKLKPPEPEKGADSADEREGRAKQRELTGEASPSSTASTNEDRGISCPPTQSRLSFDWGMGPPVRHGRSRSRSRRRAVSFSPMRALTAIAESDVEHEDDDEEDDETDSDQGLGTPVFGIKHKLEGVKS